MPRFSSTARALSNVGASASYRSFHTTRIARDHFLNADRAAFEKAIGNNSKKVLVQFTATWCQPCRILGPVLQRLTGPGTGNDLVVVDVDEQPELAGEYKVSAVPFVIGFKNGKPKDKFIGMQPEPKIKEFIEKL